MSSYSKDIFCPLVAAPFTRDNSYFEILPCNMLRPYIRCFWGGNLDTKNKSMDNKKSVVIPDVCMDIIFDFDADNNLMQSGFCTVDEEAHIYSKSGTRFTSMFGIRFYAWTAGMFAKENINGMKNVALNADEFFPYIMNELVPLLSYESSFKRRAEIANYYFLKNLDMLTVNYDLINAVTEIIHSKGQVRVSDMARSVAMSQRQIERKFKEKMGISPKGLSSLIRYQFLWQDICCLNKFDIQDLVCKYGYFDQAHLLNDFKRKHGMTIEQAVKFAKAR